MPLYDYECAKCGVVFEVRQKFSDDPLKVHEGCGGELTKLVSAPAFQLKGSGWYVTDYGRGGSHGGALKAESSSSGDAKSESKGESKSDSKSDSKSESKSETKSESKPAATKSESSSAPTTPKKAD
ncbi:MAG: FmdB family zinc ribbon protein [Acidobacteriota bacterium]